VENLRLGDLGTGGKPPGNARRPGGEPLDQSPTLLTLGPPPKALFQALLHLSWHQAARPGSAGLRPPKLSMARPMSGVAEWKP
jgi:hypothetical protein